MKRHHKVITTATIASVIALAALPTATSQTPTMAPVVQEYLTPRTASYGLFAVGPAGVEGNLQVIERVGGGTRFIVSLVGITPGEHYPAALYLGDCGPNHPMVFELEPIGGLPDDPFVSITDTPLPIDRVVTGDYFLYLFTAEQHPSLAACGEVGADANQ